jgi:hypothetical protein
MDCFSCFEYRLSQKELTCSLLRCALLVSAKHRGLLKPILPQCNLEQTRNTLICALKCDFRVVSLAILTHLEAFSFRFVRDTKHPEGAVNPLVYRLSHKDCLKYRLLSDK